MNLKVYLSGASKCLEDMGNTWRQKCEDFVEEYGFDMRIYNPNTYFNYKDMPPDTTKQCMECLLHHVKTSDVILCNLEHTDKSSGTCIELGYAKALGIPIIGFGKRIGVYEWAEEMCDHIVIDMIDALTYIYSYYL